MSRVFNRGLPRQMRLYRAFPVLVAALALPSDRRRERSPVFFSSLKSIAGFTSLFLPQIPIPDTSKIKDRLLNTLPSWTVESAVSTFVKRPQADIVVGISMQMQNLHALVAYYPKGAEILSDYKLTSETEEYKLRTPAIMAVNDWVVKDGQDPGQGNNVTQAVMAYSSKFPHLPLGAGLEEGTAYKLWDPERHDFRTHFSDFFLAQDEPFQKPKPPTFNLTEKQMMTNYARAIRQHIEAFISREIVDSALIVNDSPVIKWVILYPDAMDSIETSTGVTIKRNFVSALKDAGFPLDDSDVPQIRQEGEPLYEDSVIEDLATKSRMVEFVTAGFSSLVNIAAVMSRKPLPPGMPQEKPFIAIIDDEEFLTARRCVLTSNSRFGVMQQQACSVSRSPVFKIFPDAMLDLVGNTLLNMGRFEDINQESLNLIAEHSIRHWPESKNWSDVIDLLNGRLEKASVQLEVASETSWSLEIVPDAPPKQIIISALLFGRVIRDSLYRPTLATFGDIHGDSLEIQNAVLIDTGRGETEAYGVIIGGIHTIKEQFREQEQEEEEEDDSDDMMFDGPDLAKLLDIELKAGTIAKGDITQELEAFLRNSSAAYDHLDRTRYDRMNVTIVRSASGEIYPFFGLCDIIAMELSRIMVDAHRK